MMMTAEAIAAPKGGRLTQARRKALSDALTRADDEWEAEESDLTLFGEMEASDLEPADRKTLFELQNKRQALAEARAILRERGLL